MKVLGVITARGGSKGIPGKNLKPLAGKPLLAYTVESARAADVFDRVIVSTDDGAIAEYARSLGCEVPFLRPAELARDDTAHLPVMQHAVQTMIDQGYTPDAVMILQPTSPLRRPADIRDAVRLLERSDADSVLTVSNVPAHAHPMRMLRVSEDGSAVLFVTGEPVRRRINRRQDLPPAYLMNGSIYLFRTGVLLANEPSLYGDRVQALPVPHPHDISIDDQNDWDVAEQWISKHTAI